MNIIRRLFLVSILICSCIGCDQISKYIARAELSGGNKYSFFSDTLRIELFENTGGLLSMGSDLPGEWRFWIFTAGVGTFLVLLLAYVLLSRKLSKIDIFAFSLILGGGFSNLIDRLTQEGHVTDFLNAGLGSLRTGVFNIADFAITIAACVLILRGFATRPSDKTGVKQPLSGKKHDILL